MGILNLILILWPNRMFVMNHMCAIFKIIIGLFVFVHLCNGTVKAGTFDEPLMKLVKAQKPYITMLMENSSKERFHEDVKYLQEIYDKVEID